MSASEVKKLTRFKCAVCGKLTAGRVPRDSSGRPGDWTVRFPRRHKVSGVRCPGNIQEAEWVNVPRPRQPAPQPRGDLAG